MQRAKGYYSGTHIDPKLPQIPYRTRSPFRNPLRTLLRNLLEGAGDLVRVPKGLLKGIYRLPKGIYGV